MSDKGEALQEAIKKLKADHDSTLEELESAKADVEALTGERDELAKTVESLEARLRNTRLLNTGASSSNDGGVQLVEKTVLKTYGYRKLDEHGKVIVNLTTAEPGETVLVTPDQAAHGEQFGALGSREQYESMVAAGPVEETDADLKARDIVELLSYINQHSDDDEILARVEVLEEDRGDEARPEILEAVKSIRSVKNQ